MAAARNRIDDERQDRNATGGGIGQARSRHGHHEHEQQTGRKTPWGVQHDDGTPHGTLSGTQNKTRNHRNKHGKKKDETTPRMRGTSAEDILEDATFGINPAYAGNIWRI